MVEKKTMPVIGAHGNVKCDTLHAIACHPGDFSSFACITPAFFTFLQLFCLAASPLNRLCALTESPVSR